LSLELLYGEISSLFFPGNIVSDLLSLGLLYGEISSPDFCCLGDFDLRAFAGYLLFFIVYSSIFDSFGVLISCSLGKFSSVSYLGTSSSTFLF